MFSTLWKVEIIILETVYLSSTSAMNLDHSKSLWLGKELTLSQTANFGEDQIERICR